MFINHQKIVYGWKTKNVMSQVKQLYEMHHQGKGYKTIARTLELAEHGKEPM